MDAPVQFLLENLSNLVKYQYDLISSAKGELEQLKEDLRTLRAIMRAAPGKYKKDLLFKEWERQIRGTVYEVEDIIDSCITERAIGKAKTNIISRAVAKVNRTSSLAEEVRSAKGKVTARFHDINLKFSPNLDRADTPDTAAVETKLIRQQKRQNKIVGFEDEATTLIGYLKEPSDKVEVVSIIGMPGLGKTTVAWKIFQDPRIAYEFPVRIWVNISEDLNIRDVLLTILSKSTSQVLADITHEDLVEKVKEFLRSGKFLIVMDDVWTKEAWTVLKSCLPTSNSTGKVLITSREDKVAYHANVNRPPHKLRFLTPEESWELLQYEVYEGEVVPVELEEVGSEISRSCDGLPLSIVVIGGILKDKIADARGIVESIKKEWDDVSERIHAYLGGSGGDQANLLEKIVRLSYERLPYELRDCFLYLGVFPEDANISAKKLTLLWIAEGFIHETSEKSLEEIASDNLKDLINRNLLMVEKSKPTGEAKICRVHDTIRQFCRTEANFENLNLFQEVSWTSRGVFVPPLNEVSNYRRLCIHSSVDKFFKGKPKLHNARTFLCFSKSPIDLGAKDITPVTEAFYLLRVLDAESMKFPKFPQKLVELIHLRYLTLTMTGDKTKSLPKIISNLWNLQTLIVELQSRTLDVHADIWTMRHLRHLKSKSSITLLKDGKGEGGEHLQTLERLSPQSCTDAVFNKACNLVKLGVQGDLSSVLGSKSLEKLERLKKLKLLHKAEGPRGLSLRLPETSRFPPNLKILVLVSTHLDWDQMRVLMALGSLEALKLKENAFTGESWNVGTGGFKNLQQLDIERADVKHWTASEDSFPKLRFLLLKNCEGLQGVPFDLRKLEILCLERVTELAVASAERIKAAKGVDFMLKVAPSDDNTQKPQAL